MRHNHRDPKEEKPEKQHKSAKSGHVEQDDGDMAVEAARVCLGAAKQEDRKDKAKKSHKKKSTKHSHHQDDHDEARDKKREQSEKHAAETGVASSSMTWPGAQSFESSDHPKDKPERKKSILK